MGSSVSPVERARDTFSGSRVLLTGHTGFKGAWLGLWLAHLGAEVHGLALAPDDAQQPLFDAVEPGATFVSDLRGDVSDLATVEGALETAAPDFVFHLAAQPLVRLSYEEPLETIRTNVMGTANVLEAVRHRGPTVVVCITSDKCYENVDQLWPYRETDALGGADPYSASKGAAEIVVQSYHRSFFSERSGSIRCASGRAGNVIGGGDFSKDRLVPDVVRAARAGEPVVLRNPEATRPWQHVLESLSGYVLLAAALRDQPELGGPWNFGPDPSQHVTVEQFVRAFLDAIGRAGMPTTEVTVEPGGPSEASRLSLDVTRARHVLGWSPPLGFDERLALTAAWYAEDGAGRADRAFCLQQIGAFESMWSAA